jgi:transcriptional regulator with XRE-family HTH domain
MSRGNSLNQRQSFEDRLVTAFGGMSLKQIAEKLDVKYTSLWNWAKGRTAFPLDKLAIVGQLTGYSINWLLTGEGDRLTVETRVFSDSELAVKVNELDHKLFTIELFVVELARLNEFFRKMLAPDSFERANKIFKAWSESIETFDEYGEAVRQSSIESRIQDLGTVDEFLAASIEKYDNALLVLQRLVCPRQCHDRIATDPSVSGLGNHDSGTKGPRDQGCSRDHGPQPLFGGET